MGLDETFVREIKRLNGDGKEEAKFKFLKTARQCKRELSTPDVMSEFDDILKKYGRATVGVCVAATIYERRSVLSQRFVNWADEVLKVWTNRPEDTSSLAITDNLHPTRIQEYAGALVKYTTYS